MVRIDWVRGDATGLAFPTHPDALREAGTGFLTDAFRAYGTLSAADELVATASRRCREAAPGVRPCSPCAMRVSMPVRTPICS